MGASSTTLIRLPGDIDGEVFWPGTSISSRDLAPKSRDEGVLALPMAWLCRHDRYGDHYFVDPMGPYMPPSVAPRALTLHAL
jgi:hypothetical protein